MSSLTSQINVVVDTKTKNDAVQIFDELGLSMSTAINIFLKQVINHEGLPFEIKTKQQFIKENEITDEEIIEKLMEAERIMANGGKMYTSEEVFDNARKIIDSKCTK